MPSTIAASTTWPWPLRCASSSAQTTPKARNIPPPPKSPTRFSGGTGACAGAAEVRERAGERDVVDVVAGGLRERPVLAPAGHPPVDEARVAGEALVGPDAEALHHARAEALDERVGALDQVEQRRHAVGVLQVDGDVAPAAQQHVAMRLVGRRPRDRLRPVDAHRPRRPCRRAAWRANGPGPMPAISMMR